MKKIYFTPGPSQTYPMLKQYIDEALSKNIMSISHRSEGYMEMAKHTQQGLRKLLKIPSTHHIFFMSSSLESMERIIANCVNKHSHHFVNGSFAKAFLNAAIAQGKTTTTHTFSPGEYIDMNTISIPHAAELICLTQNETSNGSCIPMKDIYTLKKRYPRIPLAVDIVSSAPYPAVDFKAIDIAFFSVQKGFGLPSGLGILIVNDALVRRSQKAGFHDFSSLAKKEALFQTPETPNVLYIFLLGKVVQDMLKKGIATIRKETNEKARLVEEYFETHSDFGKLFIADRAVRSQTVLVIELGATVGAFVESLAAKGFVVGKGYGEYKKSQIRIANFPQHSVGDFKRLVKAIALFFKQVGK